MRPLITGFGHFLAHRRDGIAAVEFAVIAPVLIVLLAGAANVGLAVDHAIPLSSAARAGAQYATAAPNDLSGAQAAAAAILSGASVPTPTMSCTCPATGQAVGGATVDCVTNSCTTGVARYISVTVNRAPTQIPGLAFFSSAVASRTVVARVQ